MMDLTSSLDKVKGIGPKTLAILAKAQLHSLRDLIYHLPKDYLSFQGQSLISELKPGKVAIKATVDQVKTSRKRRNLALTEATLRDSSGAVRAVWFNQAYRAKQLDSNKEFYFSGNFEFSYGRYQLMNPSVTIAAEYEAGKTKYLPVYSSRGNVKSQDFLKFIKTLKPFFSSIPDLAPLCPGRADALFKLHFPENDSDVQSARRHLALEELFILLLASELSQRENLKIASRAIDYDLNDLKRIISTLPFKLTDAQRRSLWEILQDISKKQTMNRLLQGDVGSGKTLVAALAAHISAKAGFQAALLAPTEILATQHAKTLSKTFAASNLNIALLLGATKRKDQIKKHIANGEVDLVIGTHAILTSDTKFKQLGLAIIDEQHRFGVKQRQALLEKSYAPPHLLSMTATPIPRSLQLTVFGDLAISIIDQLPAGRQAITTKIVSPNSTAQMWEALRLQLRQGRQAYYVCKMIEEDSSQKLSSVKQEFQKISKLFPDFSVALIHGKIKSSEKEEIMQKFVQNEIQILVSTTVIEVGINVPNATVIIIADADRYGLAQLHQLRGRVGRGSHLSYCYLINSSSAAPTKRLQEIEKSNDGFYLAEVDLKLRGPGQIYGSLQHGILDLKIANITDTKLIHQARTIARKFVDSQPDMLKYPELAESVRKYQRLTILN